MKLIINLLLVGLIIFLAWMLVNSIREPIAFKAVKDRREQAVIDKLITIRNTQEMFRSIKEGFAPSFDSLAKVLKTEDFAIISVEGDPDDPNFTGEITYDTSYFPAIDSINALGINLDSLRYVPYGEGATFSIAADTITYQSTNVPVVEVGIRKKEFMGKIYGNPRFKKYDQTYNPESVLKFGNLNAPQLGGSWDSN